VAGQYPPPQMTCVYPPPHLPMHVRGEEWLAVRTHCIEMRRIHIHHSILAHSEYRDEEEDTHMS